MELSALTDADVRKLRDMARRIGAGGGSQKPNHKRRRGKQSGGGGGSAVGFAVAWVSDGVGGGGIDADSPGCNPSRGGVAVIMDEATGWTEPLQEDGDDVTKDILNFMGTAIRASSSAPLMIVGVIPEGMDVFIPLGPFELAWLPGLDTSNAQAAYHSVGERDGKLGGRECGNTT